MGQALIQLGENAPASIDYLVERQELDGGWGYRPGSSWVEPTALSLISLGRRSEFPAVVSRGVCWLHNIRLSDGSWPALAGVEISAGATAPAVIALLDHDPESVSSKSIDWLLSTGAQENSLLVRLRRFLVVGEIRDDEGINGWPWAAGASAWVMPTAWSLAALKKLRKSEHPYLSTVSTRLDERIIEGESFLESRVCSDGGWNHGGNEALGYEAPAYPETTGAALVGLAGSKSPVIPLALKRAEILLSACRSRRAIEWLSLGLLAHGVVPNASTNYFCRDVVDVSLALMVAAAENGRNPLLDL